MAGSLVRVNCCMWVVLKIMCDGRLTLCGLLVVIWLLRVV